MSHLMNLAALMLFGMFCLFYIQPDIWFILAFLCAVILCCTIYTDKRPFLPALGGLCYFAAGAFCPQFLCFYPAAVYVVLRSKKYILLIPGILIFILSGPIRGLFPPILIFPELFCLLTAFFLERNAGHCESLEAELRRTQDDSKEHDLLLTEKNRTLLEKQDYEIYTATLRERNRIARDIHDSIGHILSSALLQAGAINALLTQQELKEPLRKLQDTLQQGMENARRSVHDLYDTSVDFQMELHRLLDQHADLPITLQYQLRDPLPPHTIAQLLAVITEGIHNMEVHADVHHALLKVLQQPGFYQLILRNDGVRHPIREGGMGLANIRKRIYELGGHVHIHCTKDCFQLFITLPIRTKEETSCD